MLLATVSINSWLTIPEEYQHARWEGVHLVDVVFPCFVALSGCGLGFAYARRVPCRPVIRRFVVLLVGGLAYNAYIQMVTTQQLGWANLRWTGVLQSYAVVTLLIAALHLVLRRWWAWLAAAAVVTVTQVVLIRGAASACPSDLLTRECNPLHLADETVFGRAHLYAAGQAGHDPEGIFATLGILATALIGTGVANALGRRPPANTLSRAFAKRVARAGVIVTTAACGSWLTSQLTVPMKRLWTPPLALGVAAVACAVVVLLAVLIDHNRWKRTLDVLTYPLISMGRNSLLVYFGSHVFMTAILFGRPLKGQERWADALANQVGATTANIAPFVACYTAGWLALTMGLHAKRIYFRP